jgi:hypothetical protein
VYLNNEGGWECKSFVMKKLFVLLSILLFAVSCDPAKRLQKNLDKYCPLCPGKDSTVTTIEYKDKIVELPGDTTVVVDTLYCDSLGNIYSKRISEKESEIIRLQSKLKNNVLTTSGVVKTQYITVRDTIIRQARTIVKTLPAKEVKYIPWWVNFLAVLGGITFIFILLYIIYKLTVGKWKQF